MINAIFHVQATWLPNHWLSVARATQGLSALETGFNTFACWRLHSVWDALLRQQVRAKARQTD